MRIGEFEFNRRELAGAMGDFDTLLSLAAGYIAVCGLGADLAQVPLTLTNATIATAALIRDYFPEKAVTERKLMLNMGVMNVVGSFFGGMPMCHGALCRNFSIHTPTASSAVLPTSARQTSAVSSVCSASSVRTDAASLCPGLVW